MADATSAGAPRPTRFQRVQQILDAAAAGSTATYQGYGPFWRLPLPEFLRFTLYGIPMIAPAGRPTTGLSLAVAPPKAEGGSCCGGGTAATAVAPAAPPARAPGRGAASGLVHGLKGEYPFDGSQFPRLPWGGKPVSAADIRTIEEWIDDGCPDEPEPVRAEVREHAGLALARGDAAHPPAAPRQVNAFRDETGLPKLRKNVAHLGADEKALLRDAIRVMRTYDPYFQDERSFNYWARIHANLCQHGWEEFLTWHRAYLYFFEQRLQDVHPTVTLPYWDWTEYDQDWTIGEPDSGAIPEAFRCWVTSEAIDKLKGKIPDNYIAGLRKIVGQTFNSGLRLFKAAGIPYGSDKAADTAINTALLEINQLWHRLRWPGPDGKSGLFFEAYPTPDDIERILQLPSFFTFGSGPSSNHFFGALENIHNLMHNFSGGVNPNYVQGTDPQNRDEPQYGDMEASGVTAFDPIFWSHHSNVDRLWAEWQARHTGADPDDPSAILPPFAMTVAQTLNIANLGYEYVKSAHLFPTDAALSYTRFRSAPAGVPAAVLTDHRRAEVRVHGVRLSVHGGGAVRAFLNQPDANADTPGKGNDHYVGQANLFSGYCVGGPGHCEPPAGPRRKFDLRPRHHKTPVNIRLDATATVARLVAAGATDLHVTLVVVGVDGKPRDDILRMDGVSLVFLD
jgi:tyrosinase